MSVVHDPDTWSEPVTWKTIVTPATGAPDSSWAVAVTVCDVPTGFVAAGGVSVTSAGPLGNTPVEPKKNSPKPLMPWPPPSAVWNDALSPLTDERPVSLNEPSTVWIVAE